MREPSNGLAATRATDAAAILIEGETGTGKNHVAAELHALSPRAKSRLLEVSLAAIDDNLVNSELFGHEEGAFTGAVRRRVGRFEAANGGTLLLDEMAKSSLTTQKRLLRIAAGITGSLITSPLVWVAWNSGLLFGSAAVGAAACL